MTSVIGHVLSIDFPPKFQNWETTDPASLFDAPTIKTEATPKVLHRFSRIIHPSHNMSEVMLPPVRVLSKLHALQGLHAPISSQECRAMYCMYLMWTAACT